MENVKSRLDEALTEQSKYCYPNTDVLINKLGITNQEDLDMAERRITTLMLMDLQTTPLPKPGTFFTPEYYFSLHKKIFEHIYSFAGETRNENITKGNTPFCRPEYLYSYMRQTFDDLAHKLVKIKDKEDILDWLAYSYGELNIIHPFREGNGRVAREYLRQAVEMMDQHLGFNYELNLSSVTEKDSADFMNASIFSAMTGDNSKLKDFFRTTLHEKTDVNLAKKER